MSSPVVELEAAVKAYTRRVVFSDLTLCVEPGCHLLVTGPTGAGKSTLLRLVAGLEPMDKGYLRIVGWLASNGARIVLPAHRRGIGMVFQDLGLWPNLTAFDNVMV